MQLHVVYPVAPSARVLEMSFIIPNKGVGVECLIEAYYEAATRQCKEIVSFWRAND